MKFETAERVNAVATQLEGIKDLLGKWLPIIGETAGEVADELQELRLEIHGLRETTRAGNLSRVLKKD